MAAKPRIAIVGAGNLGSALAVSLRQAGYRIAAVIVRSAASRAKAQWLAKEVGAPVSRDLSGAVRADVFWFCVPDGEIARAARAIAAGADWRGKIALHSSGVLASNELALLRGRGAAVASVHPLMTFVAGSRPSLAGVPFAIEGDTAAVRMARRIVRDVGGSAYSIRKADKAAYHAWATFASPLFTSLLATSEQVAAVAGVKRKQARQRVIPILLQTLANYAAMGAPRGFSGPIVRGDLDTVKRHLSVLRKVPAAREVYLALALAALHHLPTKNKKLLRKLLDSRSRRAAGRAE
jgi:predicted short-subunit dehydrogenase-like oxidoreductase (DUF2520 family)